MPGPTRRPGPGPWRYGSRYTSVGSQPRSTPAPFPVIRPTIITIYRPRQWQGDPVWPNIPTLTAVAPQVQTPELNAPPQKRWPEAIEGQQYFDGPIVSLNYDYPQWNVKGFPSDAPYYNLALLTPTGPPETLILCAPISFEWRPKQWSDAFDFFPNIASITFTPPPQPPTTQDAGRHHKRYKVKLGRRTVYFATRAEAEAARDRHRDVLIVEARASGVDPRKIKVRRARITQVSTDGRHPPELAPAAQIARSHDASNEILEALKEARMREEEEIAIALLLAQ